MPSVDPHANPDAAALDAALVAQALRIYRRYQLEFVEALNLCPWAERARLDGKVTERVLLHVQDFVTETLRVIDDLEAQEQFEIGLLIYPQLRVDRPQFDRKVADLGEAYRQRTEMHSPVFAMAAFHPDAPAVLTHAERLIPFIRRSPDPTIQLVRATALDRVREGSPEGTHFVDPASINLLTLPPKRDLPLRERIARANLRTIERVGVDAAEGILQSIFKDRDESYARIG
ncbi:MAG TPA: DUF1415 family protein [Polyangiaceae bacterium]|nr:DUF1415 family protein [Polyangiaceae bacterium]